MNTKKFIAITAALIFTILMVSNAQQPFTPGAQEPAAQIHFAGVGLALFMPSTNGPVKIAQIVPDSPAARAGLKTGSAIVSINGDSTANLTLKHCVELIRGEAGTQVALGLVDLKTKETNIVTLTRALLSVPPAKPAKP